MKLGGTVVVNKDDESTLVVASYDMLCVISTLKSVVSANRVKPKDVLLSVNGIAQQTRSSLDSVVITVCGFETSKLSSAPLSRCERYIAYFEFVSL